MDQEQESAGVSRGQNQLHLVPEDGYAAAGVLEPFLGRVDATAAVTQLLVVTNDVESAAAVARSVTPAASASGLRVLAATDARRSQRVQRASPAHVVVGAAPTLVELLRSAALKLDRVVLVGLAWVDDLDAEATAALETLMAELPRDAVRVILASSVTPAVEQFVERYARRARRVQATAAEQQPGASLSYVATTDAGREAALRRTLDALDPESAFVVARTPASRATVESLLRSLGYGAGASDAVRVGESSEGSPQVIVLFDLPAGESELRSLVRERASSRIVALVTPRQVASLRRLAGGTVSPLTLPDAAVRAQSRENRLLDELRQVLASGHYSRELLALEPLLSDYDGIEIAAAALRLLDSERARPQSPLGNKEQAPLTRLYLNVGSMDNVRPGDLVGAITNEAGISKSELGKVDVRERHSTVEVSTAVANNVVSKLTGVQIRGRRVLARVDEERPRERPPRDDDRPWGDGARRGPPRDRSGKPSRPHRGRDSV